MKWKLIGNVAVDSGELMIGDPCYFIGDDEDCVPAKMAYESWGTFCEKHPCEEAVHGLKFDNGREGMGVACSTRNGDGFYPVFGLYEKESSARPEAMIVVTGEVPDFLKGVEK